MQKANKRILDNFSPMCMGEENFSNLKDEKENLKRIMSTF